MGLFCCIVCFYRLTELLLNVSVLSIIIPKNVNATMLKKVMQSVVGEGVGWPFAVI